MEPGNPRLALPTRVLEFRLDETPTAWGRAVPVARQVSVDVYRNLLRNGKRVPVDVHTPDNVRSTQVRIARAAHIAAGRMRFGLCEVEITAVFPRPARLAKADPGRHPYHPRPDVDNLAKNVLDALQRGPAGNPKPKKPRLPPNLRGKVKLQKPKPVGIIADDALVYSLIVRKFYAAADEQAHLHVVIRGE